MSDIVQNKKITVSGLFSDFNPPLAFCMSLTLGGVIDGVQKKVAQEKRGTKFWKRGEKGA